MVCIFYLLFYLLKDYKLTHDFWSFQQYFLNQLDLNRTLYDECMTLTFALLILEYLSMKNAIHHHLWI